MLSRGCEHQLSALFSLPKPAYRPPTIFQFEAPTGHLNGELVLRGIIFPQIALDLANKKVYNNDTIWKMPLFFNPPLSRCEQGLFYVRSSFP